MKRVFGVLLLLSLLYFWTAIHRFGGDSGYELILKPYPSMLVYVGGGEEGNYRRKIDSGEFPVWLANKNYISIASGDIEENKQPWEYLHSLLAVIVFLGWPLSLLFTGFKAIRSK